MRFSEPGELHCVVVGRYYAGNGAKLSPPIRAMAPNTNHSVGCP
jgi:hypothetical protein